MCVFSSVIYVPVWFILFQTETLPNVIRIAIN